MGAVPRTAVPDVAWRGFVRRRAPGKKDEEEAS